LDPETGDVRWLTADGRIADPDVSPDGRTIVAVRNGSGRRDLVAIDVAALQAAGPDGLASAIRVLASAPDTAFTAPRWSPDGERVAVVRQHGADVEQIVVVAPSGSTPATLVTTVPDMRWATPTWHPNGNIIAAGALGDAAYNLFEIDLDSGAIRQLTHTTGGATWPDVSSDGQTLLYVGYGVDGSDIYEMPYTPSTAAAWSERASARSTPEWSEPASARSVPEWSERASARSVPEWSERASARSTSEPYSPWPTITPTSW